MKKDENSGVVSTEQKIINQFRKLDIDHNSNKLNILELGVGNLGFTKIIRKAFPQSYLLGFDLPPVRINKEKMNIIDEIIVRDINTKKYPKLKNSFDVVTLGSPKIEPSFHFGFLNRKIFSELIESLIYYLKPNGYIFFVMKTDYCDNIRQENHFKRNLNLEGSRADRNVLEYDGVTDLTENILKDYGNFIFETVLIKDEDIIEKGRIKPNAEILKLKLDMNIISKEKYEKFKPIAEEVDNLIEKIGEEYGYFKIQIAKKVN